MKQVRKSVEPADFTAWKQSGTESWQPSYRDLRDQLKRDVHQALLVEQGGVCCYCGRLISADDSHIEHFRPQHPPYQQLALDYSNLHVSCIREVQPRLPLHCGHAKGGDFDEAKAISPSEPGCEQLFIYSAADGAIYPTASGDERADYMAKLLVLDGQFLQYRRAEVLSRVFDDAFVRSASDEELAQIASAYRKPDASGRLVGFGHVVARYAEQLLG